MAALIETVGGPSPNLVESGSLSALGQSPWMPLRGQGEHVFSCELEDLGAAAGTFIVEARRTYKDDSFGGVKTIFSSTAVADFPQIGRLPGNWDVRLRCSVYGAGSFNLAVTK